MSLLYSVEKDDPSTSLFLSKRNRSHCWVMRGFLLIIGLAFYGPTKAFADGVSALGYLTDLGCGQVSLVDTELLGASESGVLPANDAIPCGGGSETASANLAGGALSVSISSSPGSSGYVQANFSIQGTVYLPVGVPEASVALTDTSFNWSDNCADLVGGCGIVGGEPLAEGIGSALLSDLNDGLAIGLDWYFGVEISVFDVLGLDLPIPASANGTRILIQGQLYESVANGAAMSASDPFELILPPGATFVPDNPALSFPTITSTVPEPSTVTLLGIGLLSLAVLALQRKIFV